MSELSQGQQKLAALIDKIFEDGVVDDDERSELRSFWANQGLTVPQVKEVVDAFVTKVWGEVIADGVITDEEKNRLRAMIEGLRLPAQLLPEPVQRALE